MKLLWTWPGKFFGHLENDELRTQDGCHIERLYHEEIYGPNSVYRLIRSLTKRSYRKPSFPPLPKTCAIAGYVAYCGNVMYAGYEDFPVL